VITNPSPSLLTPTAGGSGGRGGGGSINPNATAAFDMVTFAAALLALYVDSVSRDAIVVNVAMPPSTEHIWTIVEIISICAVVSAINFSESSHNNRS
jgi:hypothetical protein